MDAEPRRVLYLQSFFGSQINVKTPLRFREIPQRLFSLLPPTQILRADDCFRQPCFVLFIPINRNLFSFSNTVQFFYERVGASCRTNNGYVDVRVQPHGSELNRRVYE